MINSPDSLIKHDVAKTWSEITPAINKLGFDYAVYCFIRNGDKNTYNAITTQNAIKWGEHHIKNNYTAHDPVVASGLGEQIFVWNDVKEDNERIKKVMWERRDYGMKAGVTVPIRNKAGQPSAWLSLSCNSNDQYLSDIMRQSGFYNDVLDIHVKSIAIALSNLLQIDEKISYAIILSDYCTNINIIADKTGMSVSRLRKLFSEVYLLQPFFTMLNVSSSRDELQPLESIVSFLREFSLVGRSLSRRQFQCIQALADGLTSTEGAIKIGISKKTFEEYLSDVRKILGCSNQKELLSRLYLSGIL